MALGSIIRIWGSADFKGELRFYENMYPAARRVQQEDEIWETDLLSVLLFDNAAHSLLRLAHTRLSFEMANPPEPRQQVSSMAARVHHALDYLNVKSLTRIGLKVVIYVDIGLSFDELLKGVRNLCLPSTGKLVEITSDKITDIALVVDYDRSELSAMLRAGPMAREQGIRVLVQTGNHEKLFKPLTESEEIAKLYANVPNNFLYFDIDVFAKRDLPATAWTSFADNAVDHALQVFDDVKALVLENAK